jgi:hypothetical protein
MRAAIMLDQLGLLPANPAADAALAAAQESPAALEPASSLSPAAAADVVAAAVAADQSKGGAGPAAAAAAAVAVAARGAWDGFGRGNVQQEMVADGVHLVSTIDHAASAWQYVALAWHISCSCSTAVVSTRYAGFVVDGFAADTTNLLLLPLGLVLVVWCLLLSTASACMSSHTWACITMCNNV